AANDHIKCLEAAEAGLADHHLAGPLPATMAPLGAELLQRPTISASYGFVPVSVGMAELERLVVFQKQIHLDFVRRLKAKLGPDPNEAEIVGTCFPVAATEPVRTDPIGQNGHVFVSRSNDLRLLDVRTIRPEQIAGED